ncbi:MAG: hypothetical protein GXP49_13955 [Deltaproteobacteria bacterium]|nr:hypothetical protein [Deltaproteobacteria bacterium]
MKSTGTIIYRFLPVILGSTCLVAPSLSCGEKGDYGEENAYPYSVVIRALPRAESERPAVGFPHEMHVRVLGNQSCDKCHEKAGEGKWVPGLKGTPNAGEPDQLKESYHNVCISCHVAKRREGRKSGPETSCGRCHFIPDRLEKQAAMPVGWIHPGFDFSLHQRHVGVLGDESCGLCHHSPDGHGGIKYVKGKEAVCSACHKEKMPTGGLNTKDAAHGLCVKCHLLRKEQGGSAGPTDCEGCHKSERFESIRKMNNPPRLMAGQKDLVLLKFDQSSLSPVVFDHKAHEKRAGFCTKCHREEEKSCRKCHPFEGSNKGAWLLPGYIFHHEGSDRSCIGCHTKTASSNPRCAGCHALVKNRRSEHTCAYCHNSEVAIDQVSVSRQGRQYEIPGEIKIGTLSDKFEPAVFPHARIMKKLESYAMNGEAAAFHASANLYCSACHHRSPVGDKPPRCEACHQKQGSATIDKPGLMAAYHRQCIGCHQAMNLTTKCEDCHAGKIGKSR